MQKDLKIGLISGLVLVSVAAIWLATRPSLSPRARMQGAYGAGGGPQPAEQQDVTRRPAENVGTPRHDSLDTPGTGEPVSRTRTGERVARDRVPTPAISEQPGRTRPQRFHVVRNGETLSEISYDYYGSAVKWRRIFEANPKTIKGPRCSHARNEADNPQLDSRITGNGRKGHSCHMPKNRLSTGWLVACRRMPPY